MTILPQKRAEWYKIVSMNLFLARLKAGILLGDGAMGTLLWARGVSMGACLEALVVEQPELVAQIHEEYGRAGADVITTHTFGANRMRLAAHGLADRVIDFNRQAVRLARHVRERSERDFLLAGNVGPVGKQVLWDEEAERAEVRAAFAEQIGALADAGVDLLLFETFTDLVELEVAVAVAKRITNLPVVASMSYDEAGYTLSKHKAGAVTTRLLSAGAEVVGANCSVGPAQMLETLKEMRQAQPQGKVSVSSNAGLPVMDAEGQLHYGIGVDKFAGYVARFVDAGAAMVGGCCGTTPEYIRAMRSILGNSA
jgi:homocysteine S-methyltransferase